MRQLARFIDSIRRWVECVIRFVIVRTLGETAAQCFADMCDLAREIRSQKPTAVQAKTSE
jgi:hypothetical protein